MSSWTFPARFRSEVHPATVFDVGVNRGTPELYEAFPDAYYVLVEPNRENLGHIERLLTEIRGEHVLAAAGSQSGTAVLNVETSRTGMSSFLKRTELTATGNDIDQRDVDVRTLDELAFSRNLDRPFGLKIDTEGFELEVVRGATEMLESCEFVITETSTAQRFEGGYEAAELIAVLRARGFHIADVLKTTGRYADLLFLRSDR